MKNNFVIALLLFGSSLFSQKIYQNQTDVFFVKEITFYGYDYSHFKLVEGKRMNENIIGYASSWIEYMNDEMDEKKLTRKFNKNKVNFEFDYTINLLYNLDNKKMVSPIKYSIPPDSIQGIINNYKLNEKEGVGFVVIVECFEKKKESASAYFTFFDIATKKILMSDRINNKKGTGHVYGMKNFWGVRINKTFEKYISKIYNNRN